MRNSDYWKGRFEQLERAANQTGVEFYQSTQSHYLRAQRTIEGQIRAWYQRFAANNQITLGEAKRLLNAKELAEFKWDVQDYIRYGKQNALDGAWMKQLENASARYHISRLEALKYQTQQSMEVLFGNQLDGLDRLARRIYADGYYHTGFEIQRGVGVGWTMDDIDQNRLEKLISKPWAADGKNFSDRIWQNKTKLNHELHTELTQMCMLGRGPDAAIKNIAKSMGTSKTNAGRLVMTETAYFASASQGDAFDELDVEQFEIVATLDSHTSAICQALDGKVYDMKDYAPGVTANPFHVGCRSTTVPYFDDEWGRSGERAARGKDGKTYYVPSDMKYEDWKKSFVGGDVSGLQPVETGDTIRLTEDETRAIRAYISSDSYPINYSLRNQSTLTQRQSETVKHLDTAIKKLPIYAGTVYRSISSGYLDDAEAFFKSHVAGNYVKYEAFTSSSEQIYDEAMDIQMIITSKNAADLRGFNKNELELLFARNSLFKVVRVEGNNFFMEEYSG